MTTLAVAAVATVGLTLGTCVLQLPLRRPAVVAKEATALQNLSGGRFVLGLGVGSHPQEYRRAGVDFHSRGRAMDEGVAALREAWADGDSLYVQSPVSAPIPLWFGGSSPAARRRAARVGDGWIPLFMPPEAYAPAVEALRSEAAAAGRAPGSVEPGVVVFVRVGDDEEAPQLAADWLSELYGRPAKAFLRHVVAGSPETCAAGLQRYVDAGARHVVVMVAGTPAVEHFGLVRAAFAGRSQPVLEGAGA